MNGLDAIRDPRERAERVGPSVKPVADRIDWLPKDAETLVRMQGALSLGTGALLLTGRLRRFTTLLLAAQMVPVLATEHRYWTEDDPERRAGEKSHLLKNAGLFGALLMVASAPRRAPRMAEVRRQAREARIKSGAEAKALRREAAVTLRDARREAARQIRVARAEGGRKAAKRTAKSLKAAKSTKATKAGAAFMAGRACKPNRAARTGKTVKAGTAAQAARAMKAGRSVKAGTAVQAGKVRQAVKR
ncbi:DoxX family protein [Spirillospora sp. NBC_00431]